MSYPDHRVADYIARTVQSKIGDTVTTRAGDTYAVHHDDVYADPGAVREDEGDAEAIGWVETRFIQHGAGKRGASILQCDVWRRVLEEGAARGDPYGADAGAIADALCEVFTGVEPATGVQRGVFDVEEWSNPASPTSTGECMLCINTRGDIGEPEDGPLRLPTEDGYQRVVVRFRFQLMQDATAQAFYTA